jgi:hypothetical protein
MSNARLVAASIVGLLFSGPLAFADPAQPPAAAPTAQNDPDAIVCRSGEVTLGSRLPGPRVCQTQRQWDALQKDSAQELHEMQQRDLTATISGH